MKYIYKGMAMSGWGDVSGSVLLTWHEKVSLINLLCSRRIINASSNNTVDRSRGDRLYSASDD